MEVPLGKQPIYCNFTCASDPPLQVLAELKEYATEVDVDFVRKAVRAIGRCAIKVEVRCVVISCLSCLSCLSSTVIYSLTSHVLHFYLPAVVCTVMWNYSCAPVYRTGKGESHEQSITHVFNT